MKKNYIYSLAATFITAALAMGSLTACSVDDIFASHHNAQAKTYTVSIPASIGEGSNTRAVEFGNDGSTITTSFENTDKIYVALEHGGSIIGYGHTGSGSSGFMPLTVTPDAGDAKKAAISGALKFYNMNNLPPYYIPADPSVGDLIHLYYNANSLDSDGGDISFYYSNQDGSNLNTTGAGSCDFALATMKVKSLAGDATDGYSLELCQIGDDSKSTALFENIGSMFRQHLTFKDKNSQDIAAPAIKKLTVGTKNETLIYQYDTKASSYRIGTVDATSATSVLDANNDVYLALMFHYDANHLAADDQLVLSAEATDGNVYQAAKNVPSGGFVPGKYYHGQMELAWLKQYVKPTVTRNDTHAAIDADDEGKRYNVYTSNGGDPIDITISGDSYGYDFEINSASTVTLTGNGTATVDVNWGKFLWSNDNITVNMDGDYTINCPYNNAAISLWGNLKLSGNGSLTVKVNNPDNCGFYCTNYTSSNNNHATTTKLNVSSQLAADGHTVMRSARTDGPDADSDGNPDYYTWTYTVYPYPSNVNLAALTGNYTALDGQILTGTLDGSTQPYKISIADGATVTLDGVTINGVNDGDNYPWAGINCEGDATIILKDGTTNVVKGFYENYPGIYIAENKTLTIQGNTGTLAASPFNGGGSSGSFGAGIGGGGFSGPSCGNIVIEGGFITATGGQYAAGIGCGTRKSCGNITISGGTVTAYGHGGAAGIGSGNFQSSCGNITISGTASVTASCASDHYQSYSYLGGAGIGSGYGADSHCGDINISTSGIVTAMGGTDAAGIGSATKGSDNNYCGNISITGGTITAEGKRWGAGIGSGYKAQCGTITIGSGIISVSAKSNDSDAKCIGAGYSGTCGTVTVATGLSDNGMDSDGTRVITHQ